MQKKGGILFSAHVGNWAIAGNLLKGLDVNVNVLMVDNEHQKLKSFFKNQKGGPQFNVIAIKDDLSHLIAIYKAIKRGELVCINADRFLEGSKTIPVNFFDQLARFPEGPFAMPAKLKVQYSFVFAWKESKFGYKFSATPPKGSTGNPEVIAQAYASELEQLVRNYPRQWFNYYDFFRTK